MSVGTHESRSASMMPRGSNWATWCPRIYRGKQNPPRRGGGEVDEGEGLECSTQEEEEEEEDGWVRGKTRVNGMFVLSVVTFSPTSWKPVFTGATSKFTQLIPRGSR